MLSVLLRRHHLRCLITLCSLILGIINPVLVGPKTARLQKYLARIHMRKTHSCPRVYAGFRLSCSWIMVTLHNTLLSDNVNQCRDAPRRVRWHFSDRVVM